MINIIKKFIPKSLFQFYHYLLAVAANFFYGRPSDKLIVIGVTGTSGKSTVCYLIAKILEKAGYRVGCSSTIFFKVDKKEWLNDKKMTMVGRFALQRLIRRMAKANCQYAIIETTSQGIEQFRHWGINYDILIFTNLYPEHIEAHGSFDNYKNAKLKLFRQLKNQTPKLIAAQKVKKTIVVNLDDDWAKDFLANWAEVKYGFTLEHKIFDSVKIISADFPAVTGQGIEFSIDLQKFAVNRFGRHNIYNTLAAVTVGLSQGLSLASMADGLEDLPSLPGNFEFIKADPFGAAQDRQPFKVIVDYAYEPKAVAALYENAKNISHQKIIHILGSCGGGRDCSRRLVLGELAGRLADYVIVTNEDPYDEDPKKIIDEVAQGAKSVGKKTNQNLFKILDRRAAIAKAFSLAGKDDIVLITGKGSEQAIVMKNNKKMPWDDRTVAREELEKLFL